MDYVYAFNAFEACLWTIIGMLLIFGKVSPPGRWRRALAAVGFLAFAGSELVEMSTGAWWRPWWLLVWKAVCIAVLTTIGVSWFRNSRRCRNDRS
ncbi:MAG: hypothetical protein RIK87_08295 [Fuerstiella sp.]